MMKFATTILGVSLHQLPELAAVHEEHGFESLWMPEHLVMPAEIPSHYPYAADGRPPFDPSTPLFDPWVLFAAMAVTTSAIRFATNVYIAPLRHPLVTARALVTLDRLSQGRVTLGIGVGWLKEEFTYLGQDFATRGRRTDSIITTLRSLFSDEVVEIQDEHFSMGPLRFEPKPRLGSIPIEVGGVSRAALQRAGRLGDGWIEVGSSSIDDFRAKLAVVRRARLESGRVAPFEVTVGGELARDRAGYGALAEAGATRIVVDPSVEIEGRLSVETVRDWSGRFAEDVILPFQDLVEEVTP
jgi:probable F420-dependent oxidoreductase